MYTIGGTTQFWLGVTTLTSVIATVCSDAGSTKTPDGIEGRDFFYNEAQGRRQPCAGFCDLPTDYSISCKKWCYDYKPKNRTDEASSVILQSQTPAGNSEISTNKNSSKVEYIPLVVTAVCIICLVVTGFILGKCFKDRLQPVLHRLREIFCEKLTNATLEEGAHQPSEPATQPFLHQPSLSDICVGQGSQPASRCLQVPNN